MKSCKFAVHYLTGRKTIMSSITHIICFLIPEKYKNNNIKFILFHVTILIEL